jgi:two-component system sensor histidine kinase RegB
LLQSTRYGLDVPKQRTGARLPRWAAEWMIRLRRLLIGSGERRARLRTLIVMRWLALVGQTFTILLVHFSLGFPLPLLPLLAAVALSAAINVALELRSGATTRLTERSAGLLLGYDVLQLGFLLALTGGLQNPFSVLLMVPITLSATILSLRTTILLCSMVTGAATLMGLFPTPLPWAAGGFELPGLYVLALWVAIVLGSMLIGGYAWRVADEARRLANALAATQMALAREQQLSALGGLAAAAAHELGSPLATIAVTARELANSTPPDSPVAEDIAELVGQSQRCRDILRSLSQQPASGDHATFAKLPLSHLLATVAEPYRRPGIELEIEVDDLSGGTVAEPAWAPAPELRHALGNLIDNAVQFARSTVWLRVVLRPDRLQIQVADDGPGFAPEVLDYLGEPYLSTRRTTGGLGLGLFIAQTLLARTGATLHFENRTEGACATVTWHGTE